MGKKKPLSKQEFDKKIKVWTILVPLITCLTGSATTVGVAAYLAKPSSSQNLISLEDRLEANKLSVEINDLAYRYHKSSDLVEKQRLDTELRTHADEDATIMRKYNPNYVPRWPQVPFASPSPAAGAEFERPFPWRLIELVVINVFVFYCLNVIISARIRRKFEVK